MYMAPSVLFSHPPPRNPGYATVQQARDEEEDELDVVVDEHIKQERKQAKLEYQLSAKRPG